MKPPSEVNRPQCKNHTEEPHGKELFNPQTPNGPQDVSLYGKSQAFPRCRKREGRPLGRISGFRLRDAVRAGKSSPSVGDGGFVPPRRAGLPPTREACSGLSALRWAPVTTPLPVAGAMEAPGEAEVENEDGDSTCGDLCFMDKGLRR